MKPPAIIRQIVGNCHVFLSYREVFREVIGKLRGGYATYRSMPRQDRRKLLKWCVECHDENRELYLYVNLGHKRRIK